MRVTRTILREGDLHVMISRLATTDHCAAKASLEGETKTMAMTDVADR